MQSFTFSELDERGQRAAIKKYTLEILAQDDNTIWQAIAPTLTSWRFTIHGERVA